MQDKRYYLIDIKKYNKLIEKYYRTKTLTLKDINDLIEGEVCSKDITKYVKI